MSNSGSPLLKKHVLLYDFTPFLESYYQKFNIGHRAIIFGKLLSLDLVKKSRVVDLFDAIGIFLIIDLPINDLPTACYPSLVQEFYANMYVEKDYYYVCDVRGQRICLNSTVLNGMVNFKGLFDCDFIP